MNILIHLPSMPYALPAVQTGGLMARLMGAGVTLLQTTDLRSNEEQLESAAGQAKDVLGDLPVEVHSSSGGAVKGLLAEIRAGNYEMVVLRARRAIRYRQRLGHKVARRVAIDSPIPVLIVKGKDQPETLRRILICTGGKDVSNPVIRKGAELAAASGASVTLLHITSPVPSMYTGMDEMEETFEELMQTDTPVARHLRQAANLLVEKGIEAHLEIRQGDVTEEILAESEDGGYDLIVIGASPHDQRLKEWFMGDVTRNLVNHAACPLLVVR